MSKRIISEPRWLIGDSSVHAIGAQHGRSFQSVQSLEQLRRIAAARTYCSRQVCQAVAYRFANSTACGACCAAICHVPWIRDLASRESIRECNFRARCAPIARIYTFPTQVCERALPSVLSASGSNRARRCLNPGARITKLADTQTTPGCFRSAVAKPGIVSAGGQMATVTEGHGVVFVFRAGHQRAPLCPLCSATAAVYSSLLVASDSNSSDWCSWA